MKNFLLGLGLGVAAGVMMAPASGDETRRRLRQRASGIQQRAARMQEQVNETFNRGRRQASELLEHMPQELGESIERAMSRSSSSPSAEEEHFGIRHHKGLDLIQGGRPEAERPVEEVAARQERSVIDVLNHASRDELRSVRGIGLVLAKRIIRHRPYATTQDVLERGTLTEAQLQQIMRGLVQKRVAGLGLQRSA